MLYEWMNALYYERIFSEKSPLVILNMNFICKSCVSQKYDR